MLNRASFGLYTLYVFICLYVLLFIENNWNVSPEQNVIIQNHSIIRTYSLIRCIDRQLFLVEWNTELQKQAAVLRADCYSKYINTLIPTLVHLKFVNVGGLKLHASESKTELAISAKNIISSVLAPIPVIHETNCYVNSLCPSFPFAQWTLWRTVMIHGLFFHSFYWIKTESSQQNFHLSTAFSASPCAKFHVQFSGWTKRFMQVQVQYLI